MPKVGMEPVRRRQMIAATIETIHEVGFPRVTMAQVARRAGVSQGLVAHYFRDKAGLLEATMRHIAEQLKRDLVRASRAALGPHQRLDAILEANFSERSFDRATLSAWVAFWGQTHRNPQLGRIQRVLRARLKSNLAYELRQLVPAEDARAIAVGLSVFVDGLSLRTAMGERELDRPTARAFAADYLDTQLAKHGIHRERRHAELA
jgi:transcriptional repressor BetI